MSEGGSHGGGSNSRLRYCIASLALGMAGCVTHIPQALTPKSIPTAFTGSVVSAGESWPDASWWRNLGSPELSDLIARAQVENPNLAVAAARVLEANAQTKIQRAALFPQINVQGLAERGSASTIPVIDSEPTATSNDFGAVVGANYGLDLWGLARDNLRAANETLKSVRFTHQAAALALIANVANGYFNLLALRERAAIVNEDITAINSILDVIKLKVTTGKSSHLDLAQEQAQFEAVQVQLTMLNEQEVEAHDALAVLVGQPPETLDVKANSTESIHPLIVAPGLPSDLLWRRPDIAQAEANLASAHANLDAARAAFLPQFSLTTSAGYASTTIGALLRGPSFLWESGVNIMQTIFDGGKLSGQKGLASATQRELIASYQSAVLNAYADVENALGQATNNRKAEDHLRREVQFAGEAFEISELQYRQGAADLIIVLQAQQTLFAARDQLAQTTLARMQAAVHLYQALGGGWIEKPNERTQFPRSASDEFAVDRSR